MTRDPLSPQWEDCKACGGDHWTKDHPTDTLPDSIADIAAEHGVTEAQLRTALSEAHPDADVAESHPGRAGGRLAVQVIVGPRARSVR